MDAGLLIARLVFGLLTAAHGCQWWIPQITAIALATGVVGGLASLALRARPLQSRA